MKLKQTKSYFYQQIIKQKIKIYPKKNKKLGTSCTYQLINSLKLKTFQHFFFQTET